jgi:hypothetical protein
VILQSVLADLCLDVYDPVTPGVFDRFFRIGDATFGMKIIDGSVAVIVFAGTENASDFLHDLDVLPYDHPQLGTVHAGFWEPMQAVFDTLREFMDGDVVIAGHSLGAAHAALLCGLCAINDIPVAQLFLLASPRVGDDQFTKILRDHIGRGGASFKNGIDPVPDVPLDFNAPLPITVIHVAPSGLDEIDPIAWHSCHLYVGWFASKPHSHK